MTYRKFMFWTAMISILLLFMVSLGSATDIRNNQTTYGVKGGFIGSAVYYTGDREFESAMSYSVGSFLDYKLGPRMLGGLAIDIHGISDVYETNVTLFDLSATLKAMVFSESSNLTFRPQFAFGYGNLGDYDFGTSSHLLLKAGLEIVYSSENKLSYLGEIMLIGSVDGGNDDVAITFGPALLIRGGLVF